MKTPSSTIAEVPWAAAGPAQPRVARRLTKTLAAAFDLILVWQQRVDERRSLRAMTEHQLKDIGVPWVEIEREAAKPFWRA